MSFIVGVAALNLLLLFSGYRLLIGETTFADTVPFADGCNGDYTFCTPAEVEPGPLTLSCRYYTGRSVLTVEFRHKRENFDGKDECPFFYKA
jgi:hypothetical protein